MKEAVTAAVSLITCGTRAKCTFILFIPSIPVRETSCYRSLSTEFLTDVHNRGRYQSVRGNNPPSPLILLHRTVWNGQISNSGHQSITQVFFRLKGGDYIYLSMMFLNERRWQKDADNKMKKKWEEKAKAWLWPGKKRFKRNGELLGNIHLLSPSSQ